MNITTCYNLSTIIKDLEVALQIEGSDFEERSFDTVLNNIRKRIGRQYQIDLFGRKIDSTELELGGSRNQVALYIDNIAGIHALLCGYCQIVRYQSRLDISMEKVNYLGFKPDSLTANLSVMQRRVRIPSAEDAINAFKAKLTLLSISTEKRLFVLLIVSYELGFYELTSCIAELLYLACIK